jgi:hypothetical protein
MASDPNWEDELEEEELPAKGKRKSSSNRLRVTPTHLQNYGVVRELKTLMLDRRFNDPVHFEQGQGPRTGSAWPGIRVKEPATETERQRSFVAWSSLPWAPSWDVCEDVGWWKGKWSALFGEDASSEISASSKARDAKGKAVAKEDRRWGGWYDEVVLELSDFDVMQQDSCVFSTPNHLSLYLKNFLNDQNSRQLPSFNRLCSQAGACVHGTSSSRAFE